MKSKKLLSLVSVSMVCAMLFSGCAYIPKNFKLIDINNGEDTITLGYGNFAAMYDQVYSSYYGTSMWGQDLYNSGNTFEEDVKSDVIDTIEEMYLLSMHASEYGVELSADDEAAIKKAAAEFMKNNSKDAIKQVGATEEYVADFISRLQQWLKKLLRLKLQKILWKIQKMQRLKRTKRPQKLAQKIQRM